MAPVLQYDDWYCCAKGKIGRPQLTNRVFVTDIMCENEDGEFPYSKEELSSQIRKDASGVYGFLCVNFIPSVVGAIQWRKFSCERGLQTYATLTDEAFMIFTLENNYDTWVAQGKRKIAKGRGLEPPPAGPNPRPMYTDGFGKLAKKFSGWSEAGRKRFNELALVVKRERENDHSNFDREFLSMCKYERERDNGEQDWNCSTTYSDESLMVITEL